MSDPTSIFNADNSGGTPPITDPSKVIAPIESELTDLLNGIKNERGEPKYKTLKDALVGLQNAQGYIPDLKKALDEREAELSRVRAEAARVTALEDTVRQLTERGNTDGTPPKALSEQEIADLVNRSLDPILTQREQAATQKQNVASVVATLKESFGADAEKKFYEKATELGMTVAEFNALAAKSPKAVLSTLGLQAKSTPTFTPTQGTVNTQAFTPRTDTFVGRNDKSTLIGATTQELMEESRNANKMVEELHAAGKSVHDLSDPKVYFKQFGKR
jgi:hypothetical protein